MKKALIVVLGVGVAAFSISCTSFTYKPAISLNASPKTIKATVQIETFADETPPADKWKQFGGVSATEPGTLAGELAIEVTDAVLTDFSNNLVFDAIKKKVEGEPDLIMNGRIHRFYGKAGPNAVFWFTIPVDIVWLCGVPVLRDKGEVDLEISLRRPGGPVLATYRAKSQFGKWYTIYNNPTMGIGTRLNRAFSECIANIRQQIVNDAAKLSR